MVREVETQQSIPTDTGSEGRAGGGPESVRREAAVVTIDVNGVGDREICFSCQYSRCVVMLQSHKSMPLLPKTTH